MVNNPDTYRLYDALEAGVLPLLFASPGTTALLKYTQPLMPQLAQLVVDDAEAAAKLMVDAMTDDATMARLKEVHRHLSADWAVTKTLCRQAAHIALGL